MQSAPKIMTVNDVDPAMCGALVYWSMSGTTNIDRLTEAWLQASLDEGLLPAVPSPETALRRAVKDHASKHVLARRIDGGWALVNEKANGDDLEYGVILRIKLDKVGRISFEEGPTWTFDDRLKILIETTYARNMDELSPVDMSLLLVKLVGEVESLRLRDTGGFYFVPRHTLLKWREFVAAIRASSMHDISEIPALTSDEAVDAVLTSLHTEAERAAVEMEQELSADELGEVALRNRSTACEKMLEKVGKYEQLLGVKQNDLRARIEDLRVNLAHAALMAGGDE